MPEDELPLMLPEVKSYEPSGTGERSLSKITDWVNTTCPKCGGVETRDEYHATMGRLLLVLFTLS